VATLSNGSFCGRQVVGQWYRGSPVEAKCILNVDKFFVGHKLWYILPAKEYKLKQKSHSVRFFCLRNESIRWRRDHHAAIR